MAAHALPSLPRRLLIYAVGLAGFLLTMDVAIVIAFVLFGLLFGGPPNHYLGIVVFLLLPPLLALGIGATWWAGRRIAGMQSLSAASGEERAHEAIV